MSFLTHTSENVLWMSSSLLDGSGVRHGFSTRIGGVSPAPWDSLNLGVGRGDDMDRVRENYRRFCAALGPEAEPYITRRGPKWHVDLKGVNARWLEKAGVRQIDVSPDCTACHPELYWSHRRMGQARGAQIAMICL